MWVTVAFVLHMCIMTHLYESTRFGIEMLITAAGIASIPQVVGAKK